ncbi:protein GRAVITROPIC IN THE LIGHT 1-like isoform X2 [Mercurialis annua]|nr:protein GRAVITROPIC IN THE LIGHT 1-like isoform X2 [Mercurialis annua]XP_050219893.1 protein GRAVITROPIC IN THE LIGHT 1-like isoform X2 [Mercurialis annua]
MDSVKLSSMAPKKSKFARTVAKVLHLRAATGISPTDGVQKVESEEVKNDKLDTNTTVKLFSFDDDKQLQKSLAIEALLAKLFASISSIKAAYAQLQYAQSPYDVDGIQAADQLVVSELKSLSEFKQCYNKKQFDSFPDKTVLMAELQEQKSVSKIYEIMGNKLESQMRLKDSEIIYLKEKLDESDSFNQLLEKRLNQSGQISVPDNLHRSGLNPSHFIAVVRFTVKSIRSFVKLMMDEMKAADWDVDAAAGSIAPDVVFSRDDDRCFAFESFVCREFFDGFQMPNFSLPSKRYNKEVYFKRFTQLKSMKAKDYLSRKSKSKFAKFCRAKYLQIVHPKMESSFFGNLSQRSLVSSGGFPDTSFFASFAEAAKRVWVLHCLAFSFEPEASVFQVSKGCRFSEVYMECVAEDSSYEADPPVAFTVVPGFRIGKTIIQSQVYLSPIQTKLT